MKNRIQDINKMPDIDNLKEVINFAAENHGNKAAFIFERDNKRITISYNQFKQDINALATVLVDMVKQNNRISILGENSYEWLLTYFATTNSGNVIVPIDKELSIADIQKHLDLVDIDVFVYSDKYSDIVAELKKSNSSIKRYINIEELPDLIKKGNLLIKGGNDSVVEYKVNGQDLSTIAFTSGTTGDIKGVMLTHKNITLDSLGSCQYIKIIGSNMLVLPLHHTYGFTSGVVGMLIYGSEMYINSSLRNLLAELEKFKPHNLILVPLFVEVFYKKIWEAAKKQGKDAKLKRAIRFSRLLLKLNIDKRSQIFKTVLKSFGGNLKLIVTGGAHLDEKYICGMEDFGINVFNGYGITECSPVVAVNSRSGYRAGSVGQVLPCCKVKIINKDNSGNGEICVKGDTVMMGYYNNEIATQEAFSDGWFKTGDIGYMDKDGFLYITGRKKNIIILNNGKNVYPEEFEKTSSKKIKRKYN